MTEESTGLLCECMHHLQNNVISNWAYMALESIGLLWYTQCAIHSQAVIHLYNVCGSPGVSSTLTQPAYMTEESTGLLFGCIYHLYNNVMSNWAYMALESMGLLWYTLCNTRKLRRPQSSIMYLYNVCGSPGVSSPWNNQHKWLRSPLASFVVVCIIYKIL